MQMENLKGSILVVEDEAKIAEALEAYLKSKGFVVFLAENGSKALEVFEREDISLILLDLMLPEISGEEVCAAIRKRSRVPIIMLTAKADETDMVEGLNLGADDYISKPFSLKALSARIEAVMRRSGAAASPLYGKMSFNGGDLELDLEIRSVMKGHKEVKLTPNEYRILTMLLSVPNRTFTRDELIAGAFADDFDGFDRAVDTHIKNIRQKIEDDPRNPTYIVTAHGIGYRFEGD